MSIFSNIFSKSKKKTKRKRKTSDPAVNVNDVVVEPKKTKSDKKSGKKEAIPKALREQVWIHYVGKKFSSSCKVCWCKNQITCFNFDCGHNIPESKGGALVLNNLRPICRNCNLSMGASYSIDEWNHKFKPIRRWYYMWLR